MDPDVPTSFNPPLHLKTKGAVVKDVRVPLSEHLPKPNNITSHANNSCCPQRQNQHFPNNEEDYKVVGLNAKTVKSQLYSILK